MLSLMYDVPVVSTHKYTMLALRILAPACAAFSVIALVLFGASGALNEFCKALEPDAVYLGQPCDYGNGFGCTLVAFICSFFQVRRAAAPGQC